MATKQDKPVRMSPPPAKKQPKVPGMGLGLLVGGLFGLLVGAIVLLVFQLQRQDAVEEIKDSLEQVSTTQNETPDPLNVPITPRPMVIPDEEVEELEVPEITATVPADKAEDVSERAHIEITFSTLMDFKAFTPDTITVVDKSEEKVITDRFAFTLPETGDKTFEMELAGAGDTFERGITIEVTLSGDLESSDGVPLGDDYTFSFDIR